MFQSDTFLLALPFSWGSQTQREYYTRPSYSQETNIHAPGGIRTYSPSKKAAANPRLRQGAIGTDQDLSLRPNKFMVSTPSKYQLLADSRNRILWSRKLSFWGLLGTICFMVSIIFDVNMRKLLRQTSEISNNSEKDGWNAYLVS
jgi:hypothetical protein